MAVRRHRAHARTLRAQRGQIYTKYSLPVLLSNPTLCSGGGGERVLCFIVDGGAHEFHRRRAPQRRETDSLTQNRLIYCGHECLI